MAERPRGGLHVTLLGRFSVCPAEGGGEPLRLSGNRAALLAALAAAEGPLSRLELMRCAGYRRGSVNSTLTKTARALGLDRPFHRCPAVKTVELDRTVVGSDLDEVRSLLRPVGMSRDRAERLLALGVHRPVIDLWEPPAGASGAGPGDDGFDPRAEAEEVRREALRRLAWFDLGLGLSPVGAGRDGGGRAEVGGSHDGRRDSGVAGGAAGAAGVTLSGAGHAGDGGPVTARLELRPDDPAELWLARSDHLARTSGRSAALDLVDGLGPLARLGPGTNGPPADLVARLVVETAGALLAVGPGTGGVTGEAVDDVAAVLEGMAAEPGARVVVATAPSVDPASLRRLVERVGGAGAGVLGVWVDEVASTAGALVDLFLPVLADQVRRPEGRLPHELVLTVLALWRGERLEPVSDMSRFCTDLHRLHRSWLASAASGWMAESIGSVAGTGDGTPLLVVGRHRASAPDLDRALAHLLRLDPGLRVVIVHDDLAEPSPSELDGVGCAQVVVGGASLAGPALIGRTLPSPAGTHRTSGPVDGSGSFERAAVRRLVAAVSFAADEVGAVEPDLADHLLEQVGSSLRLIDVVAAAPGYFVGDPPALRAARSDGDQAASCAASDAPIHDGVGADPVSTTDSDRTWLAELAVGWLTEHRLGGATARRVLRRLGPSLPVAARARAVWRVRAVAAQRASHGDHELAVSLLDDVVSFAPEGELAELLVLRGAGRRDLGRWDGAQADYRRAVELLDDSDDLDLAVEAAVGLARLTWDPALGVEVDQRLRTLLGRLPERERTLRARVTLCLAGGSFQDGGSGLDRAGEAEVEEALVDVAGAANPRARAWGLVHGRKALLGVLPVERSVRLAEDIVVQGRSEPALWAHGHQALFVDRVRQGRWDEARVALEEIELAARGPVSAEQRFSALVARTCWDLARGDAEAAAAGLDAELEYRGQLGGSTFDQVTLAHQAWLARLQGDAAVIDAFATAAAGMARTQPGGAIWAAGATLLAIDCGRPSEGAGTIARHAREVGGFDRVPRGPHRLPVLCVAALAAAASPGALSPADLTVVAAALDSTDVTVALIGWPTVVLGPVARFQALAAAALGHRDQARSLLDQATTIDHPMPGVAADTSAATRIITAIRP